MHRINDDQLPPGQAALDGEEAGTDVQQASGRPPGPPDQARAAATAVAPGRGAGPAAAALARLRAPWLLCGGALLLAAIGLFVLYLRQSQIAPVNADGASISLQAWDMLHGNLLLHGWWSADVSFYTTELPEYMLVEAFRGLRPDVVHIGGALTYTLMVLLAALLARGRAKGRPGIVRALVAGGIMLAPGIIGGTPVFLENPDHAGTAVPILVLLLILDRAPERWYVAAAVSGLLAWIQVADQLSLVAATAPLAAVAALRLLMLATRRRPPAEFRYDALLLAAAGLSVELARFAQAAIRRLGGFDLRPLPHRLLAPAAEFPANARTLGKAILLLFGANRPGQAHHNLAIIADFHLIGLALAAAGFAVAVATLFGRRTDRVTQILVGATAATLAAGIATTILPSLPYAHEVAILLPFGAVLAGRVLPPLVPARWRPGRWAVPALATWLAAGLAALCFAATWAPMQPPNQALADWLVSHRYTEGLATYWQANSTTLASGGRVLVAPVTYNATSVRRWESSITWYDARHRRADFVVAVSGQDERQGGLSTGTVREAFGRPDRQYRVGQYVVMVYGYNLLTRLRGRAFPGGG